MNRSWISGDERAGELRQNRARESETFSRVFVSVSSSSRPSHRARGRSPVTGSGASVAIFRPPRRALTHRFCRWRAPLRHTGTRDARAASTGDQQLRGFCDRFLVYAETKVDLL